MAVSDRDVSNYDGAPIMLYEFSRRSTPTFSGVEVTSYWRYTSADRDFTIDGNVYAALSIEDDGIRQSGDTAADQLTLTMPYNAAVPQMFVGSPPSDPIYLIIRHANEGETDSFLVWAGLVAMVSRASGSDSSGDTQASVVCNTVIATMDRTGLRLAWGRSCPHDLYGFECKADPKLFSVSGVITGLDGIHVTVAEFAAVTPPRIFSGGFLEWITITGQAERLGIIGQTGDTITVLGLTDRLVVGQTVTAFLGCDHTRTMCETVFDNIVNHGGHAYMPDINPFSGDLIF